ncbi:MAG TPA: copper resistance protein CopC [Deltaproteobacteria bacterium]|jgi:methionine-rich copper-binding protein CopC|nr:copper resistance protein CopC [Deltaproteobacteria bacterium]
MPNLRVLSGATLLLGLSWTSAPPAGAHAFLDHAVPRVGSTVSAAPSELVLAFTQELEPAFSTVEVLNEQGAKVDKGDVQVDPHDGTLLRVSLNPLAPGTYKVIWRVVSVDTHPTEGDFTFHVAP